MRGLGIGRINGGWSRVVGYVSVEGGLGVGSPIWGISAKRAWWSLNSVGIAVVIAGVVRSASAGSRSSQWSRGVLVGAYVGVRGSPRCLSLELVMKSAKEL